MTIKLLLSFIHSKIICDEIEEVDVAHF